MASGGYLLGSSDASGTDIAGANVTIAPGLGTGTGNAGVVSITAAASKLATGSTLHTAVTMLQVGNAHSAHVGTTGAFWSSPTNTYTDRATAISGTAASAVAYSLAIPTLAAGNTGVTTTAAATWYIAGAPAAGTNQTITNAYSMWVDAGNSRFDGRIGIGTTSPLQSLDIEGGTGGVTEAKFGEAMPVYLVSNYPIVGFNTYWTGSVWRYGKGSSSSYGGTLTLSAATGDFTFETVGQGDADANGSQTTLFTIQQSGNVVLGSGDASATPVGALLRGADAAGTNIAGITTEISAGLGTGSGNAGILQLQASSEKSASGTGSHPAVVLLQIGNTHSAHVGTTGAFWSSPTNTYTDRATAGSGTAASAVAYSLAIPTLAAANASVTTTNASTLYLAGAPAAGTNQTLTNAYALWVDDGNIRLDGQIRGADGSFSAPTYSFTSDPDTGMTSGGSDSLNFFAGAGLVLKIETTGISINSGSVLGSYVEGTFTPTVTLVGGAGNTVPVYSTNTGRYTRIGNRVFVDVYLTGDGGAEGAGTGTFTVAIPIVSSGSHPTSYFPCGFFQNGTAEDPIWGQIAAGTSVIDFAYEDVLNNFTVMTGAEQNSTTRTTRLKFTYEV